MVTMRGRPSRQTIYDRLDYQIAELWQRMGGLPSPVEAAGIWRDIWFEEAHNSTAIEGNTLVLKQVKALLEDGRAVGHKELSEYLEVRGYADAAEWVYKQAIHPDRESRGSRITVNEIRRVHQLSLQPAWDVRPHPDAGSGESPGSFRRHDIHPFPEGMTPPTWPLVEPELAGWVEQADEVEPRSATFPEQLASLHCRFEQIHPFIDGNGRTGRLLLNLLLVRLGYPPAIIYKKDRERYLRALRKADGDDPRPLGEFLARAILDNLYRFVVPAVAGDARLVPLQALASREITASALRTAAIRGALQATRAADGQWRSTRRWVDEYLDSRYRRRD